MIPSKSQWNPVEQFYSFVIFLLGGRLLWTRLGVVTTQSGAGRPARRWRNDACRAVKSGDREWSVSETRRKKNKRRANGLGTASASLAAASTTRPSQQNTMADTKIESWLLENASSVTLLVLPQQFHLLPGHFGPFLSIQSRFSCIL